MEFVVGETLDWRTRMNFNTTSSPFGWKPKSSKHDLSVFEDDLRAYADAIGLLLSLLMPPDALPGPVGGGFPKHSIFFDEDTWESKLPYKFESVAHLAENSTK